jgi:hypothetical protein
MWNCTLVQAASEALDAADVHSELFAPGAGHLVVECVVALVRGQVVQHQVVRLERGQTADQNDRAVPFAGPVVDTAERFQQIALVAAESVTADRARARVELEVELGQLGLQGGIRQIGQDRGVAHRRLTVAVHEIDLDLQAGQPVLDIERDLVEHEGEHVEAAVHLLPVPGPVLPREVSDGEILAHPSSRRGIDQWR